MKELAAALVGALADLTVIEKGHRANAGSYSYDYADLGDLVKATRPVLAKHDLVALTPVHAHDQGLACSVVLVHSSGETMQLDPLPFPPGRDAQATGSAITYHRRYALLAAWGMATGEDDDGARAVAAIREDPVPGLRSSVLAAVKKLPDGELVSLIHLLPGTAALVVGTPRTLRAWATTLLDLADEACREQDRRTDEPLPFAEDVADLGRERRAREREQRELHYPARGQ